jgi:hypothetical protein
MAKDLETRYPGLFNDCWDYILGELNEIGPLRFPINGGVFNFT